MELCSAVKPVLVLASAKALHTIEIKQGVGVLAVLSMKAGSCSLYVALLKVVGRNGL